MLIDCDRTLLNDNGLVTERTIKAIKGAIQNEVAIVFASGRALGGIKNIVSTIGEEYLFDYFVCFNGGMIVRARDNQIISETTMTVDDAILIKDSIGCAPKNFYVVTSNKIICYDYNEHASIEAKKNGMQVTYENIRQLTAEEKIFKVVIADEEKKINDIECQIQKTLRQQFNITRSEPNNIEIMPLLTSKGHALTRLADILKVKLKETVCIGDSENDLSMLTLAGTSIAMGNASEKLKTIVDIITDSNNNDGVAKAIEKLILSKAKPIH